MDVYNTPGAFSWSELMTSDPTAAGKFYSAVFGWNLKTMDMASGPYTTFQVGDVSVGGLMKIPAEAAGMPPLWGCYVTVANVEDTIRKVEAAGGKVVAPPMDIPSVGRMAVIADPQGATLSIIKYAMPST